jgi:hypothetical protein
MIKTYIRFERGRDGVIGPTFGPFDFVQLTYDELRVGRDGEPFALFDQTKGDWFIRYYEGTAKAWGADTRKEPWSDIIIWGENSESNAQSEHQIKRNKTMPGSGELI